MTVTIASFTVIGEPAPKGSMKHGRGKRLVADNPRTDPWAETVAWAARQAMGSREPWNGPVRVSVVYRMPRPKGHYKKDGTLRVWAPKWADTAYDRDKLDRCLNDAMQGIVFTNDARNVSGDSDKVYVGLGEQPCAEIRVEALR